MESRAVAAVAAVVARQGLLLCPGNVCKVKFSGSGERSVKMMCVSITYFSVYVSFSFLLRFACLYQHHSFAPRDGKAETKTEQIKKRKTRGGEGEREGET